MKHLHKLAIESEFDPNLDPAQGALQISDKLDVLDDAGTDLGQAAEAANQLEQLADAVAIANPGQELTAGEAIILDVALEHIYQRLGMEQPDEVAMESEFGNKVGEKLSQIREQVTRIVQALVDGFLKALDYFIAAVKRFFSTSNNMRKKAEGLRMALRKVKGSPKEKTYRNAAHANELFVINGSTESLEFHEAVAEAFSLVEAADASLHSGYIQKLEQAMHEFTEGRDVDRLLDDFLAAFGKSFNGFFSRGGRDVEEIMDIEGKDREEFDFWSSEHLPGGKVAVAVVPKTTARMGDYSFSIAKIGDAAAISTDVPVSSIEQMERMLDDVIKSCDTIIKFQSGSEREINRLRKKLAAMGTQVVKVATKISDNARKDARGIAASAPLIVQGVHAKTFAYALRLSVTVLDHCASSIKQYEGADQLLLSK